MRMEPGRHAVCRVRRRLQCIIRTRHRDMLRTIKPAGATNQFPKLNNNGMARYSGKRKVRNRAPV